ncbi:MAG: response regulator [Phycisphaera sp. RhM]|nr:response regulator [Phycisphaera sp. RhM]
MKSQVLLIEDNPVDAHSISRALRDADYDVKLSTCGESGLAMLRNMACDIVLCDLMLPGLNGIEVCREIKHSETLAEVPVVLLTRYSNPVNILLGLQAGVDGFISKDRGWDNLIDRMVKWTLPNRKRNCGTVGKRKRVAFLDAEFDLPVNGNQLIDALLFGLEDISMLNTRVEDESQGRATALKRLRETDFLHHSILETLPIGIAYKSIEGEYISANAAACTLMGKERWELIGRTDYDLYPYEIAERMANLDHDVLQSGSRNEELRGPENQGAVAGRFVKVIRDVTQSADAIVTGIQVLLSDVTDSITQQTELLHAKEVAEQASLAKSRFLACMTHELRTPLNGILGMADLLTLSELTETQERYVQSCRQCGEALLHIINNILDFSKLEAGKVELECREVDLERMLTDVCMTLSVLAEKKGLRMICRVDEHLLAPVKADSHRIRQILYNLISNAIKFTDAGEVDVRARLTRAHGNQGTVVITVSDTGIGISADEIGRLFDSFSQANSSVSRSYGGTGLGLHLAQLFAEAMGGAVSVESIVGDGSTFRLELPVELTTDRTAPVVTLKGFAEYSALVVDDNQTNREMLTEYLNQLEVPCVTSSSVDDALAKARRASEDGKPFSIALIDYKMPGRNGLDLAKELRTVSETKVLLITSIDVDLSAGAEKEHHIDEVLRKPFRRYELMEALKSILLCDGNVIDDTSARRSVGLPAIVADAMVLLVEDDRVNQGYMVELLRLLGCKCDIANDGVEAIQATQQQTYDLILMDCELPNMDGFEASRRIRHFEASDGSGRRTPIIALTAKAIRGDRQRYLDSGMDDFVAKPAQIHHIRNLIGRYLVDKTKYTTTVSILDGPSSQLDPLVSP